MEPLEAWLLDLLEIAVDFVDEAEDGPLFIYLTCSGQERNSIFPFDSYSLFKSVPNASTCSHFPELYGLHLRLILKSPLLSLSNFLGTLNMTLSSL